MPLLPFATLAELRTLKPELTDDLARLALTLASGRIRAAVGWDVDQASGTYTRLYRPGYRTGLDPALDHDLDHGSRSTTPATITLPAMNVTGVASVTVDDAALTADQWDASTSGIVYLNGVRPYRKAVVAYTAGWVRYPEDTAPVVFKECCLEVASDIAGNIDRLRSYSIGGDSESFMESYPLDEDPRLGPYRVNL